MPACHAGGRGFESRPFRKSLDFSQGFFVLWQFLINAIKRTGRYWYNKYGVGRGLESSRKPSGQAVHSAKALTLIRAFFLWHSKQKPDPKENKVWSIGCF